MKILLGEGEILERRVQSLSLEILPPKSLRYLHNN